MGVNFYFEFEADNELKVFRNVILIMTAMDINILTWIDLYPCISCIFDEFTPFFKLKDSFI